MKILFIKPLCLFTILIKMIIFQNYLNCISDTSKFNTFDSREEKIRILKEGKFILLKLFIITQINHTKLI